MKKNLVHVALSALFFIGVTFAITTCSRSVNYNPEKKHHGKNSFKTTIDVGSFDWYFMMFKEGSYPAIEQKDIDSVLAKVDLSHINSPSEMPRATWIGHATVLVQHQGVNFLTDPHLTDYPSPFDWGSKRFTQPALTFEEMPKIDFMVISHNHYDHLDHRTVDFFGNSVIWFVPLGLKTWFLERGIAAEKVIELDWWDSHQFAENVKITFAPNVHWSKRTPWDTNKSLWGSWAVQIDDFNSLFAGDTGYDKKLFKKIGEKLGPFQLAMIPIGAYVPRYFMSSQHLDPAQAVLVHQDLRAQKSVPIHWATFQLSHEPFLEPPELLAETMKKFGLPKENFRGLKIGETIEISFNQ